MHNLLKFGRTLKNIRASKKMSLRVMSELCDIAPGRLSEYENGHRVPTTDSLERIIKCLKIHEVAPDELNELREAWDTTFVSSNANVIGQIVSKIS